MPNFQDIFKDLMPLAISQAVSAYAGKQGSLITTELEKLREATRVLNE